MLTIVRFCVGAHHEGVLLSTADIRIATVRDNRCFERGELFSFGSARFTQRSNPAELPTPGKLSVRKNRPQNINQVIQKFPDLLGTHAKSREHALCA